MIQKLKPYPAYKDSGVEWLGKVPEGWEVKKLLQVTRLIVSNVDKKSANSEVPVRLCNYVDVYNHEVITEDLSFMQATATKEEIRKFAVKRGDVAITKDSEIWNDIGVPAYIAYEAPDLIYGYHLAILRPSSNILQGKYLFRTLQSQPVATQLHVEATGVTRFGLTQQAIKSMQIPLPTLPEQRAIVKFLDWADRRIKLIIAARKKRIQLLEEYRQTLINDAVTGKFDVRTGKPYPAYKDSGVEWLGKVPEGWTVRRLKSIVRNINEQTSAVEATTQNLLLSLEHVEGWSGKIRPSTQKEGKPFEGQGKRFLANDILFGKLRPYLAKVARPQRPGICVTEFLVLRPTNGIEPAYLEKLLRSHCVIDLINSSTYGAKMPRAEWDFIGSIFLPLPPLPEQRAIAEYLDRETKKIDAAIEKTKKSIELWEELRATLIADVVTGKLDVRKAAEGLPEEEPGLKAKIEAFEASLQANEAGVDEGAAEGEEVTLEETA